MSRPQIHVAVALALCRSALIATALIGFAACGTAATSIPATQPPAPVLAFSAPANPQLTVQITNSSAALLIIGNAYLQTGFWTTVPLPGYTIPPGASTSYQIAGQPFTGISGKILVIAGNAGELLLNWTCPAFSSPRASTTNSGATGLRVNAIVAQVNGNPQITFAVTKTASAHRAPPPRTGKR